MSKQLERVLSYGTKYQNSNIKHDCTVLYAEVEFILYLTGADMRFISFRNLKYALAQYLSGNF